MKKNGASKNDAVPKYDSNAVCGVMSSGTGGAGPSPVGGVLKGSCTRYWDCCKVTYLSFCHSTIIIFCII